MIGRSWKLLSLLAAGVTLLLLIACVNAGNLFLARHMDREREFSARSALGRPRSRLVLQLFSETILLFHITDVQHDVSMTIDLTSIDSESEVHCNGAHR